MNILSSIFVKGYENMKKSKNVSLFLLDGEVTGRTKCTLANWTGVVYKIPRALLSESKDIPALNQSSIYMLFGTNDNDEPMVYIGQAGIRKNDKGVLLRLMEHDADEKKDFWTEAIILSTLNDSFGPTELNYLENKYYNLAKDTGRYKIDNSIEPTTGNVTEEKVSELNEYLEFSMIPIGLLGKKLFTPVNNVNLDISKTSDNILYLHQCVNNEDVWGTAKETNEGFLLLAGSKVSQKSAPHLSESLRNRRDRAPKDQNNCLLKDVLLNSPSTAANFLIGQQTNGLIAWKNESGETLKSIREQQIKNEKV